MKFREDIQEHGCITRRWLGWGKILRHGRDVGSYFFIALPVYKMVQDYRRDEMVMGKLVFWEVLRDGENEKYRLEYEPIYD